MSMRKGTTKKHIGIDIDIELAIRNTLGEHVTVHDGTFLFL